MDTTQKQYQALIETAGDSGKFIAELFRYKVTEFRDHRIDKKTFKNLGIKINKELKNSNLYAFNGMSSTETQCFLDYFNIRGRCISDAHTGFSIALVDKSDLKKIEEAIEKFKNDPQIFKEIIEQAKLIDEKQIISTENVENAYNDSLDGEREAGEQDEILDSNEESWEQEDLEEEDLEEEEDFPNSKFPEEGFHNHKENALDEEDSETIPEEAQDNIDTNINSENREASGQVERADNDETVDKQRDASQKTKDNQIAKSNEEHEQFHNYQNEHKDEADVEIESSNEVIHKSDNEDTTQTPEQDITSDDFGDKNVHLEAKTDKNTESIINTEESSHLQKKSFSDEVTPSHISETKINRAESFPDADNYSDPEKQSSLKSQVQQSQNECLEPFAQNTARGTDNAKPTDNETFERSSTANRANGDNIKDSFAAQNERVDLNKSRTYSADFAIPNQLNYNANSSASTHEFDSQIKTGTHVRLATEQTYEKEMEERRGMEARQAEKREKAYKIESREIGNGNVIPVYNNFEQLSKESIKQNSVRNMMAATTLSESGRKPSNVVTGFHTINNPKEERSDKVTKAGNNLLQYEVKTAKGTSDTNGTNAINQRDMTASGVGKSTNATQQSTPRFGSRPNTPLSQFSTSNQNNQFSTNGGMENVGTNKLKPVRSNDVNSPVSGGTPSKFIQQNTPLAGFRNNNFADSDKCSSNSSYTQRENGASKHNRDFPANNNVGDSYVGNQKSTDKVGNSFGVGGVPNTASSDVAQASSHTIGTSSDSSRFLLAGSEVTEQDRNFSANRLVLRHVSARDISGNPLETAGKFIMAANEQDYRESMVGQKKATFTGISAFTSNRAFKAVMEQKENALFIKLNKRMKNGKQEFATLNNLLKARGYSTLDFMGKGAGRNSMESIYLLLRNSGLASQRDGRWDVKKFEMLMKKCEKKKNFDAMVRALGLSENNAHENILIIGNINELIKKTKIQREAQISKIKSGKSFRSLVAHKIGKDTAVMNGFMESKKNLQMIYSTYRAARIITILNAKGIGKAVRFVANRKVFNGTVFQKGVNKVDASIKDIRNKVLEKRDNRAKKKQERHEKVRAIPKRAVHRAKKRIYAIMPKRLQRISSRFVKIGKRVGTLVKKVNPLKLVGLGKLVTFKLKKYALIAVAGIIGTLISVSTITGAAAILAQSIATFFTGSDEEEFSDTPGGKAVMKLKVAEFEWANSLLNDTSQIENFFRYSVRYGRNYEQPETYLARKGMQYHGGNNPYVTGNPFYFDVADDAKESISKKISKIDGGVELHYEDGRGGTSRTSNIKDIISMSSVYFQHSDEAEDNFPDIDSVMDDSGKFSLSGLVYCLSNKVVSSSEKRKTEGVLWDYCQTLFNLSHQEVIELSYVVLPTCLNYQDDQGQETLDSAQNSVSITFCPDGDSGGCATYDNFFYYNGVICMKDSDGNLRDVSGQVTPTNEHFEPFVDGNDDNCNFDSVETLIDKILTRPSCFSTDSSVSYGYDRTLTAKELDTRGYRDSQDNVEKYLNGNYPITALTDDNGCIYGLEISFTNFKIHNITADPNHPNQYLYNGHDDHYTINITHECQGHHYGRFCGGHLKADITGVVYGFTDEQVREEDPVIIGKINEGEYVPQKVSKNQVTPLGSSVINDLFDIDMHIRHTSEMSDWTGWTADNMEMAIQKYNADWQELYGIDFAMSLGGTSLTVSDIEKIVALIKDAYPNLSQERVNIIKRGLGYVGNIGYSQAHHNCPLDGPCGHGTGVRCGLSDCSGFASNLWYDHLGYIYSTASFYTAFHPNKFSSSTQPGDILLHYGGKIADGVDDHALIWLGYFDYDGDGKVEGWSIDCSTVNGVGNVFFRTRNYYTDCYVVSP